MKDLQAIVAALRAMPDAPAALATLVAVEGSSYRRPGARLLLTAGGRRIGSISGGCLEEDVLARAHQVLDTGRPETVVYDTTSENDVLWGVGLGCHGVVRIVIEPLACCPGWAHAVAENFAARQPTRLAVVYDAADVKTLGTSLQSDVHPDLCAPNHVFLENVLPPPSLFVFGAGDDAQPLVRLAKEMGWHVTLADPRAAFATNPRFPNADAVVVAAADELVARAAPQADALVVVMTHHYVHDVPILAALLPRPLAYLGLLGPKQRAERILADLARNGIVATPAQKQRLHSPVGLDLGADGPEQVALAIVAEIQAVLTGRNARPLRERKQPIHA